MRPCRAPTAGPETAETGTAETAEPDAGERTPASWRLPPLLRTNPSLPLSWGFQCGGKLPIRLGQPIEIIRDSPPHQNRERSPISGEPQPLDENIIEHNN